MLGDARVDEVTIGGGNLPSRPDSTRSALPCASPCVDAGDKNVKLLGLVRRGVVDLREAGISRTKGTSPGACYGAWPPGRTWRPRSRTLRPWSSATSPP